MHSILKTSVLAMLVCFHFFNAAHGSPNDVIILTKRIALFDGSSLKGLYPWFNNSKFSDPKKVFSVKDKQLRVSGELMGSLITEGRYKDYVMVVEFKWGNMTWGGRKQKAKDAGLLFHSNGAEGGWKNKLMPHIQSQIMEGSMGDIMMLPQTENTAKKFPMSFKSKVKKVLNETNTWNYCNGYVWSESGSACTFNTDVATVHWRDWDPKWDDKIGFRGQVNLESPNGKWNQMIISVASNKVEVFFNGEKINEVYDVQPSEGKIQLETEFAEYFVRRWELNPLGTIIYWKDNPVNGKPTTSKQKTRAGLEVSFKQPKDIAGGGVLGISSMDAGDIDNDGLVDIAVIEGGKHAGGRKTLAWFKSPVETQGDWQRFEVNQSAPLRPFLGSAKLADMDSDGDLDLIVSSDNHSRAEKEADVFVFINPKPNGQAGDHWDWHKANSSLLPCHHINDMEIADMDGDGKLDIIVRSLQPNQIHVFFQNDISSYTRKSIDTDISQSEGLAVGHIDDDGILDITYTGYWLQSPSNPRTQNYTKRPIDPNYKNINQNTKECIGDIDGDGKLDVVIAPCEAYRNGGDHDLAWYRNPGNNYDSPWKKTVIEAKTNNHQTAKLGDMDNDNDLDVVVGVPWGSQMVRIYYNNGSGSFSNNQTVCSGKGLYSGVLADLGNDGDLDIIGQDTYAKESKPWIYESLLVDANMGLKPSAYPNKQAIPFKPDPNEGWKKLFDGKTLNGWKKTGYGKWWVENGVILGTREKVAGVSNPGGFLFTERADFKDFELIVDAKLDWGTDSGIHLRDISDGFTQSGDGYQCCLDYRLSKDGGGQYGVFYYKAPVENYKYWIRTWPFRIKNRFEAMENPVFDSSRNRKWIAIEDWPKIFKAHDWNQIKIRMTGEPPLYECWINGVKIVEYQCQKSWNKGVGRIGLQLINDPNWIEGGLIRFRNIFIKVLPSTDKGDL